MVIFVTGGLVFPLIAKLLMEEKHVASSAIATMERPTLRNQLRTAKDEESPLDDEYAIYCARQIGGDVRGDGHRGVYGAGFCGIGDRAVVGQIAKRDVEADQCEFAADCGAVEGEGREVAGPTR